MAFDDRDNVGDDEGGWTGEALLRFLVYRASPSTLVKAVYLNATSSKIGKEFVISVAVVAEAVDEDDLGNWFAVGLGNVSEAYWAENGL